jgi:hypothetical protein
MAHRHSVYGPFFRLVFPKISSFRNYIIEYESKNILALW